MLFSVATGVGLQKKIKEKISGFNGDIQISHYDGNNSKVTVSPILKEQDFYPELSQFMGLTLARISHEHFSIQ